MLRRLDHSGTSDSWLLIPQIEHAHLSGALAGLWGDASLSALDPLPEVVQAVTHHDDGWADWDAAPDVDRASGRPLSFVEMPLEVAIDIWRRSIYLACSRGYLAAHMVSNHFTTLLQNASPRWSNDPRQFQTSRQVLDEQSEHRESWLAQWQQPRPTVRTRKMAETALKYLQFFDALSLWFCGAPRREPQSFDSPEGYDLSIVPLGANRFTLRPWPLSVGQLSHTVQARRIPVGRYASREALAAGPSEAAEIAFELTVES